jgi:hypothetical protein
LLKGVGSSGPHKLSEEPRIALGVGGCRSAIIGDEKIHERSNQVLPTGGMAGSETSRIDQQKAYYRTDRHALKQIDLHRRSDVADLRFFHGRLAKSGVI